MTIKKLFRELQGLKQNSESKHLAIYSQFDVLGFCCITLNMNEIFFSFCEEILSVSLSHMKYFMKCTSGKSQVVLVVQQAQHETFLPLRM